MVLGTIIALAVGLGLALALLGALVGSGNVESIALGMTIGGAVVCLVAAMAGSPSARAAGSRWVVGGRSLKEVTSRNLEVRSFSFRRGCR
jgi:hypothetical protein